LTQTHIDILEDFDHSVIDRLTALSEKYGFMIFEDRKFADIGELKYGISRKGYDIVSGNTVSLQYSSGVHKIASWSHITNAHPIPGPSVVKGLASVGLPLNRGLLLLAEMSTEGALTKGEYTDEAVRIARAHSDFVIGFIAQRRMEGVGLRENEPLHSEEDFLILSPGVGLDKKGDGMGQQYRTPRQVILESGCDIIIVGRGIYGKSGALDVDAVRAQAERYRKAGWDAYLERANQA
jgi:orotidine-5'-phosphate decarboxylase